MEPLPFSLQAVLAKQQQQQAGTAGSPGRQGALPPVKASSTGPQPQAVAAAGGSPASPAVRPWPVGQTTAGGSGSLDEEAWEAEEGEGPPEVVFQRAQNLLPQLAAKMREVQVGGGSCCLNCCAGCWDV